MISFIALVLLPSVLSLFYLFVIAADQYASTVGFTVRREGSGEAAAALLGGLAQFTGSGGNSESDILYEFIQSQEIVQAVDKQLDLRKMYSSHWPADPIFALPPDGSIEDLLDYWRRIVRISYDQSTRLIELRVLAFTPEEAQKVATAIVAESQRKVNELNDAARQDLMRYATSDLKIAVDRLKDSRESMTEFRTRTQIIDPESDIQVRMGVLSTLQQTLATALVDLDLLKMQTENSEDPRLVPAQRRIDVIRERIASERNAISTGSSAGGEIGEDYPRLIAEYESLSVDRQYAEQAYAMSLAAADVARTEAARQSVYLAAFVRPTLPETSEYPERYVLSGLIILFLGLTWAILSLIFYAIRDRR